MQQKCSCVILNFNDAETTCSLVSAIRGYKSLNKIIVVDNCSTDDSFEILKKLENDKVVLLNSPKNGGYGFGNNYGLKYAYQQLGEDYALIANPDVYFDEEVVEALLREIQADEHYGAATCIQLDRNGNQIKDIAWKVPTIADYMFMDVRRLSRFHNTRYSNKHFLNTKCDVECIPGAFLLVDLNKFFEVGGYDERMFLYGEETTLGFKLRERGYKTLLLNKYTYQHFHGVSINKSISSTIKQYEMIVKSRLFFVKEYLKASPLQYYLCQKVYLHIIERRKRKEV